MRLDELSFCTTGGHRAMLRLGLISVLMLSLSACSALRSSNSPDIVYSSDSQSARALQVPPDLTDISDSEQFVLPGRNGGEVRRNTLLPQFDSTRFVRGSGENWLAIDAAPETVWPQLLAFLRSQKYQVEQTAPTSGVISTQWREASGNGDGNVLKNLLGADEQYSRLWFRLERDGSNTRLFARSQATTESLAKNNSGGGTWPSSSHDPEATSAVLVQLMTFIGVEEQKARGIISSAEAGSVLNNAFLQRTTAGSQLLINKGYEPSFDAVLSALETLNLIVEASSESFGRIQVIRDTADAVLLDLKPLHVSAVVIEVRNANGQRLEESDESGLLTALRDAIV